MRTVLIALAFCAPAFAQFTSTASHIRPASSLPSTCSVGNGDVVFLTTGTLGVYYCSSANTWTYVANAASGGTGNAAFLVTNTTLAATTTFTCPTSSLGTVGVFQPAAALSTNVTSSS